MYWLQEESSKRNGRLSVKAEVQKLSSPRGRQFAHIVQEYVSKCDIENMWAFHAMTYSYGATRLVL